MSEERSARLQLPLMQAGQAQKEIVHNEALTLLDMLVQGQAESAALATPPPTPSEGRCWIVAAGGTGAWAGRDGMVAGWTPGGWRFVSAPPGARLWVADAALMMRYDGAAWISDPVRADGFYVAGEKIVGARGGAVGDPTGGATVDVQARAAIADILAMLRAHGLIATL